MNQIRTQFMKTVIKSCTLRQSIPITRAFSSSNNNEDEKKKKKTPAEIKITLITDGNKMSVITMEQAKKIAASRQLKLVNVLDFDTKSSRAIYKLMTTHEYHSEELKRREEKKEARNTPQIKSEKLLTISGKISHHDLESKMAKVRKWIEKMHEVRVVVSADGDMKKAEEITSDLEKTGKEVDARVLQKRTKDNTIRFSIMPDIKKEKEKTATATTTTTSEPEKKLLEPSKSGINIQQVRNYSL